MTMMSNLSQDLVEEILSRVLITSLGAVRSTCKLWNALSRDRILCKARPKDQFLGFMMMDSRVCSMRFNFDGILNEGSKEVVDISKLQVSVFQVYYCDGLLLCVSKEDISRLVVWNPYLGQTRWIKTFTTTEPDTITMYALGYDKNKNHKILRIFDDKQDYYEIYDFKSSSWRVLDVSLDWKIDDEKLSASVDGNTYFWITEKIVEGYDSDENPKILICFDFTKECFGEYLPLPLQLGLIDHMMLSCVKEKKLAFLNHYPGTSLVEIWITSKIESNALLWIPFLKVDMKLVLHDDFRFEDFFGSFFIDEEKRVAVFIDLGKVYYKTAYIIGENENVKKVCFGHDVESSIAPIMCLSSYVPSLVQINLKEGEEIGLFRDSSDSKLHFSLLKRESSCRRKEACESSNPVISNLN